MIENNKFAISLSGEALKVYKELVKMIGITDAEVKEDASRKHHRYYASYLFPPHEKVGLQLHRHGGDMVLVIPGNDRRFPKCDLRNIGVQAVSGYCVIQDRFWLNATKQNCWPPKPARAFVVLPEQLQNFDLRFQINKLLLFAKENSDLWNQNKR